MKKLLAMILALLMLFSAAAAFAEPVYAEEDFEEIEEIEIVSVEEAVEEEELELEPAEAELLPEEEMPLEEALPEELPEEELTVEEEEEVPEDGNEAAAEIYSHPSDVAVLSGEKATFIVSGSGITKYQWRWRAPGGEEWANTYLPGYDTFMLSFDTSMGMNGRQYCCRVTDSTGTHDSNPATLTVVDAAKVISQPSSCTEPSGGTAKFTVYAMGKGLQYQWQWRSGSSGTWDNTGLPGCKSATLMFTCSDGMNGRQYRCVVTDEKGRSDTSSAATLTVKGMRILSYPSDAKVSENGTVKFTFNALGSGLKYQWQWRAGSSGSWANTSLNGWNTNTLSFTATAGMNGRQYRCMVTCPDASDFTGAATLTVLSPAKITAHPANTTVENGQKAKFQVKATGTGLQYQWQWRADSGSGWANTSLDGCKTATLNFSVSAGMSGRQYRCGVTGSAGGTVWSNPGTLTVVNPTKITAQPGNCKVEENGTATFSIGATGASLKYQWQWRSGSSGTWANTSLSGCKTPVLSFTATLGMHGRQYRCGVTGAAGRTVWSNAATLTVGEPLEITQQPKSCSASEGSKATFTVTASGAGLKYQWKYRATSAGDWKNTGLEGNKTATLNFTAQAIMNGRQFCCMVTDKYGRSVWSDAATLTVMLEPLEPLELYRSRGESWGDDTSELEKRGFTVVIEDEEPERYKHIATLERDSGTIEVSWGHTEEYVEFDACIENLHTADFTLDGLNTTMSVSKAESELTGDGWDYRDTYKNGDSVTISYHKDVADTHYTYYIKTDSDYTNITALKMRVWYINWGWYDV